MNKIDFLNQERVQKFIEANLRTDVKKLLLNPPKEWRKEISILADQILARQKGKGKIDHWQQPRLILPPPLSIEQASSYATSTYKKSLIKGDYLIDLTGGMGIDCLSLSTQFQRTSYIDSNSDLCAVFDHNRKVLGKEIDVVNSSAEEFLCAFEDKAFFYLDPARRSDSKGKVFQLEDCSPNLKQLIPQLQKKADGVLVKLSPLMDLSQIQTEVSHIKEIHVVSVKNDCKELLISLDFEFHGEPVIKAVNLETGQPDFRFHKREEDGFKASLGALSNYLYEPNASILKCGAFKSIGFRFNLQKLGKNTHLYTSSNLVHGFPGKVFELIKQVQKGSIKESVPGGTINVLTRNYPLKAEEVKKKYKLKDGGNNYLIGYRDLNGKAVLILATRVDQKTAP